MSINWYVLHVKPHKERAVYELLQTPERWPMLTPMIEQGITPAVFYPSVRVKPVNPRSARIRPYFPGYLFVYADLELVGSLAFDNIPGAHGLVAYGDEPAIVPPNLILALKQRMVQVEEAGGLVFDELNQGDPVKIVSGPLAGYEAIFDMRIPGADRVQVLLAFLSNVPQRIKISTDMIQKKKLPA